MFFSQRESIQSHITIRQWRLSSAIIQPYNLPLISSTRTWGVTLLLLCPWPSSLASCSWYVEDVKMMSVARKLGPLASRAYRHRVCPRRIQHRSVATHTYSHHAAALSVLPSNVDTSSTEYLENVRQFGEVMARTQELHRKTEQGGPEKAKEKHVKRGKMLPRESVTDSMATIPGLMVNVVALLR